MTRIFIIFKIEMVKYIYTILCVLCHSLSNSTIQSEKWTSIKKSFILGAITHYDLDLEPAISQGNPSQVHILHVPPRKLLWTTFFPQWP